MNEKEKKIVDTKNVFTHQDPDMIYLPTYMYGHDIGFCFLFDVWSHYIFASVQTNHASKSFFGIIIYYYTLFINKYCIKVIQ